nr:unnamed protein product [Callosobruchus analis]
MPRRVCGGSSQKLSVFFTQLISSIAPAQVCKAIIKKLQHRVRSVRLFLWYVGPLTVLQHLSEVNNSRQ